jgi:hypothetical protein
MAISFGRALVFAGLGVATFIITVMSYVVYRAFEPNHQLKTDESISLVLDSSDVQNLVAKQSAFDQQDLDEVRQWAGLSAEERQSDEVYIPERTAFLKAMARAPSVPIPAYSYFRLLQDSNAICSPRPPENPTYIKVRVTTGPMKGQEGWGCQGMGVYRTFIWP